MLPKEELKRIKPEFIEKYLAPAEVPVEEEKPEEEAEAS